MVLLAREMEAENLKANPEASAIGTIIESNIDKGAGPVLYFSSKWIFKWGSTLL